MYPEESAKYIESLSFDHLESQQFLVLIVEATRKLNWNIGPVSEIGFIAYKKGSTHFQREELKVQIDGKTAHLERVFAS